MPIQDRAALPLCPDVRVCEKVQIRSIHPGREFELVNAKQARRMLIMRQKKNKRAQARLQAQGASSAQQVLVAPSAHFSKPRTKLATKQKAAKERPRENGLFVTKDRETELKRRQRRSRVLLH